MKLLSVLTVLALVFLSPVLRAEHANIDLRVLRLSPETGKTLEETSATVDVDPPAGGHNARPLARVKADEPLALQFFFTNTYPHGVKKDVVVRYFVVREKKAKAKGVPELTDEVVTEGHFKLNLKPKARVGARVTFHIKEKGFYLLRMETQNTDSDHEHFSAIEIEVK